MTATGACRAVAVAGALAFAVAASAQDYPTQPVRLVVPYAAGEGSDPLARVLAAQLAQRLKQRVAVDNRPGASSAVGTEYAARGAPDGHTLVFGSTPELALHPALATKPAYDVLRDFAPVASVSETALLLVVHPSLAARGVRDLVRLARSRPGQMQYGSAGHATLSHLALALFCDMTGVPMAHVPHEGMRPAVADLLAGEVEVLMAPVASVLPHTQSGRLRALAVSSAKRWPTLPDVPTLAESELPGYEVVSWTGVLAPANTPGDVVELLHRELAQVLAQPEVVQRFAAHGAMARVRGPSQFAAHLEQELARWREIGSRTGMRIR